MQSFPPPFLLGLAAFILCLSLLGLGGCKSPSPGPQPVEVDSRLVNAQTGFGFRLLAKLAEETPEGNIFISPMSVTMALGLAHSGAEGKTETAMQTVLGWDGLARREIKRGLSDILGSLASVDKSVQLHLANSIWAQRGANFDERFLTRNRRFFLAEVREVDFGDPGTVDAINAWVSDATRKKIPVILTPGSLTSDTVAVLLNALYFKGNWMEQFEPSQTKDAPFHLLSGETKQVRMMVQQDEFGYLAREGFQAVRLGYGQDRLAMYVFLPTEGAEIGEFTRSLTAETWESWMSGFENREVHLELPRFTLDYEASLVEPLRHLGMRIAFNRKRADFSRMGNHLYLQEVRHKTFVEVNEEGTEAAAATFTAPGVTSVRREPVRMAVDRPFFCAIRDDATGVLLFIGQILHP